MEKEDTFTVCCWQCSEHVVDFADVLNVIEQLNKSGIVATEMQILNMLNNNNGENGSEDLESMRKQQICDVITYASNNSYILRTTCSSISCTTATRNSALAFNTTQSYEINRDIILKACELCGERFEPFQASNFVVEPDETFVDRETFEKIVRSSNEASSNRETESLLTRDVESADMIEYSPQLTQETNKELEKDIKRKEKVIDHLVKRIHTEPSKMLTTPSSSGRKENNIKLKVLSIDQENPMMERPTVREESPIEKSSHCNGTDTVLLIQASVFTMVIIVIIVLLFTRIIIALSEGT